MLTPKEALAHLVNGGKLRKQGWSEGCYILMNDLGQFIDDTGVYLTRFDLHGVEIYEEPKPKIKLWRMPLEMVQTSSGNMYRETDWFESKVKFVEWYGVKDCRGEWESMEVDAK